MHLQPSSNIFFDDHQIVSYIFDKKTGLSGYISIHRGNGKTPAFGATRIWNYESDEYALIDSLRLSKLMSYKAAMAGLHCGGAKATIIFPKDGIADRKEFFKSYAKKVNYFSGRFITGADVGVGADDVKIMRRHSKYIVGVLADPVRFTGLGIYLAMQACLKEVFGSENILGKSVAIQGVGKVGQSVLKLIYPCTKNIFITDIDSDTLKQVTTKYPLVKVVSPLEIQKQKVDIYSPCALSNCLNKKTAKELRCKIIAGGANNQLENDDIAENIHKQGILYAPDYVANAGGLISVYDEYEYGNYRIKRVEERVSVVKNNMIKIIKQSKKSGNNPSVVANNFADEITDSMV